MQLWHNVWRYTQDEQVLKDLYPLLRRTVNFYQHLQHKDASDGPSRRVLVSAAPALNDTAQCFADSIVAA